MINSFSLSFSSATTKEPPAPPLWRLDPRQMHLEEVATFAAFQRRL